MADEISLELPGGVKVLTASPLDPRTRTASLASISNDATYQVGFSPIYSELENQTYLVTGGDAVSGWVFAVFGDGGSSEDVEKNTQHREEAGGAYGSFDGTTSRVDYDTDPAYLNTGGLLSFDLRFRFATTSDSNVNGYALVGLDGSTNMIFGVNKTGAVETIIWSGPGGGSTTLSAIPTLFDGEWHTLKFSLPADTSLGLFSSLLIDGVVESNYSPIPGALGPGGTWTVVGLDGDYIIGASSLGASANYFIGDIDYSILSLGGVEVINSTDLANGSNTGVGGSGIATDVDQTSYIIYPHTSHAVNLDSGKTLQEAINDGDFGGNVSRKRQTLSVVTNNIDLDWDSNNDLISSNRVAVTANATITYLNVTNAEFATFKVTISNLATLTFPAGTISPDGNLDTLVWTPPENGAFTISIYKTGTEYEVIFSQSAAV